MHEFNKFIAITKVDAARREVYGVVTSEAPDKDGEICDYATTAPQYKAWSAEFESATAGRSLGNVREMHTPSAAGKITALDFDDAGKTISVRARVVDDDAWKKCEEGVYTGFSHGGKYLKVWQDGDYRRYTAEPSEISLVDNPCNPEAHFDYVKADGSVEVRKFVLAREGVLVPDAAVEERIGAQKSAELEFPATAPSLRSGQAINLEASATLAKLSGELAKVTAERDALKLDLEKAAANLEEVKAELTNLLDEEVTRKAQVFTTISKSQDNAEPTAKRAMKGIKGDIAKLQECLAAPLAS